MCAGSYPGDLYCHVAVETPIKLTEHQRKLLKELDESFKKGGHKHSPNDKGLVRESEVVLQLNGLHPKKKRRHGVAFFLPVNSGPAFAHAAQLLRRHCRLDTGA